MMTGGGGPAPVAVLPTPTPPATQQKPQVPPATWQQQPQPQVGPVFQGKKHCQIRPVLCHPNSKIKTQKDERRIGTRQQFCLPVARKKSCSFSRKRKTKKDVQNEQKKRKKKILESAG